MSCANVQALFISITRFAFCFCCFVLGCNSLANSQNLTNCVVTALEVAPWPPSVKDQLSSKLKESAVVLQAVTCSESVCYTLYARRFAENTDIGMRISAVRKGALGLAFGRVAQECESFIQYTQAVRYPEQLKDLTISHLSLRALGSIDAGRNFDIDVECGPYHIALVHLQKKDAVLDIEQMISKSDLMREYLKKVADNADNLLAAGKYVLAAQALLELKNHGVENMALYEKLYQCYLGEGHCDMATALCDILDTVYKELIHLEDIMRLAAMAEEHECSSSADFWYSQVGRIQSKGLTLDALLQQKVVE